jgi:hypothetical protein
MNTTQPLKIASIGSVLIVFSGVLNSLLGASIDALFYEPYPGGYFGHVGIVSGIAATVIGIVLYYLVLPMYRHRRASVVLFSGLLTIVLGHLGAIFGALYLGTAGVICTYTAGIWIVLLAARTALANRGKPGSDPKIDLS